MRHLLLTAALTLLTFAPQNAFAQDDEDAQGEDDTSAPEGSSTIAPERRPARTPSSTGKASSPGTQHTVERGDTLWDLSQKFLGSPWYWPKVWSYNPEIANPHWIYPGNEVRFFSSGEEVPTQVEVGQPEAEVEQGEMYGDKVNVFGQVGFRPKNAISVASPGFVTSREIEETGTLYGSFAESMMLSYPERIYVKFKKAPRMGETYLVFRRAGEVIHPVTQNSIGFMTEILAEVKVIRVDKDNAATVQIWKQYDEVTRGDLVGPINEPVIRAVAPRPNEREVKDIIVVADVRRYPTMLGENSLAIMDKGSDDGVKMGNVFTIYRQHDPLPQESLMQPTVLDDRYPREDIGQCVAFEVKAKVTMCLVTQSIREFVLGDHAEIRTSGGSKRAAR